MIIDPIGAIRELKQTMPDRINECHALLMRYLPSESSLSWEGWPSSDGRITRWRCWLGAGHCLSELETVLKYVQLQIDRAGWPMESMSVRNITDIDKFRERLSFATARERTVNPKPKPLVPVWEPRGAGVTPKPAPNHAKQAGSVVESVTSKLTHEQKSEAYAKIRSTISTLIAITWLFGCSKPDAKPALSEMDLISRKLDLALTNTARSYFACGMASAMLAHQQWLSDKLSKGIIPPPEGMGLEEWKSAATRIWISRQTNDPYILRK